MLLILGIKLVIWALKLGLSDLASPPAALSELSMRTAPLVFLRRCQGIH